MSEYTPGPWQVVGERPYVPHVTAGGKYLAGDIRAPWGGDYDGYYDEAYANARLIAAAPEMYEALKDALYLLDKASFSEGVGFSAVVLDVKARSRAAIAKAEGPE